MTNNIDTILKRLGVSAKFGPQVQAADFFAAYPDGVFASFGSGSAVAGWDTFRVQFAGVGSRENARRFESMLFRAFRVEGFIRTSIDGLLTLSFRCRVRSAIAGVFGRGGSSPVVIDPTWLYFTMPEGGTVTLTKNGSPTAVTLEYSLDNGSTWTEWNESGNVRSLALNAGQTMHVRNHSATSTGFSTSSSSYYQFSFDADTYAGGNVMSLKCSDPSLATMTNHCWRNLFKNCIKLLTAADMYSVTTIGEFGCYYMYQGCTSLTTAADMSSVTTIGEFGCYYMYQGCTHLSSVKIGNPDISATNALINWLNGVAATGDFYCSPLLTIPSGASGIPNGWTRHDI